MIDGSESNSDSEKAIADTLAWLKQNAVLVGLLAITVVVAIQNLVMQAELGNIRASIRAGSKTSATRELLKRAEESLAKGERDIAQVYFLNAVAKSPEDLDALNRYAKCVFEQESRDPSEIDRLRSILQSASYQVAPKHVPAVLELLAKAAPTENPPTPSSPETAVPDSASLSARFADLEKVGADLWKNRDALDRHIEQLRLLADQVEAEC
ncbi:MAG: hypothetical protein FJ405_08105 [Verrucomicrobia bacterium]|nr:hypothetical protein [Verrucomicrobiota bacterium]